MVFCGEPNCSSQLVVPLVGNGDFCCRVSLRDAVVRAPPMMRFHARATLQFTLLPTFCQHARRDSAFASAPASLR